MKIIRIEHRVLLFSILISLSGCNDIGTAKFDELASGMGLSQNPKATSIFAGITSFTGKTDSTVTLNWSAHANALQYILYNVSLGTPSYVQTFSNSATASVTLTGLTPGATYKFRLRLIHDQGEIDDNTNDVNIVMNQAPTTPSTPTYSIPVTSPGTKSRPTFTVNGVKTGDVIRLYQDDATCNFPAVATGTVGASQTSIDLQLTDVLDLGTHAFYAAAENSANQRSSCSAALNYELIKANCPTNYILVPANASLGINDDFCIAQYEMKNVSSVATSQAAGNPWGIFLQTMHGMSVWP